MLRREWMALALAAAQAKGQNAGSIAEQAVLENERVTVTDRVIPDGGVREPYTRGTDQVIVFLHDCAYDRIDAETGESVRRTRKAGETIWHFKGELAPRLVNRTNGSLRSLVIELKA